MAPYGSQTVFAMNVMEHDDLPRRRNRDPDLMLQGPRRILISAPPVFAHRGAGEFVVLRVAFVRLPLMDQLQDGDLGQVRQLLLEPPLECCNGVLETMPPSQKWSVPIFTMGGSAPLAMACSGPISSRALSK